MANSANSLYGSITVKLTTKEDTKDGVTYSADKIADDLNGKYITVTFTSTEHVRVVESVSSNLAASANSSTSVSVTKQLTASNLKGAGDTVQIYFFVNGESVTGTGTDIAVGSIKASTSASRDAA